LNPVSAPLTLRTASGTRQTFTMNPWLFLALVVAAIAVALWIPHRRLRRALAAPFPREWESD